MPDFNVLTAAGGSAGSVAGPDHLFGVEPNVAVMHQVVTAQLAAKRQGTHSTKTRAEVRGGGAKPWRQKGTGRARQGSIRAPHWRGGGVAAGPKPRDYAQRTPKKMIRLALSSALSDRAADDKVRIVDDFGLYEPKTKQAIALLSQIDVYGRILIVVDREDTAAVKSFRNLIGVETITADQLNTYDVLVSDFVVFSKATFEATCETRPAPAERKAARAAAFEAKLAGAPTVAVDDSGDEESAEQPEAPSAEAAIAEEEE
ncbi:MAG: 50S ribosomal protein L4 [Actinomycetota bacterium]